MSSSGVEIDIFVMDFSELLFGIGIANEISVNNQIILPSCLILKKKGPFCVRNFHTVTNVIICSELPLKKIYQELLYKFDLTQFEVVSLIEDIPVENSYIILMTSVLIQSLHSNKLEHWILEQDLKANAGANTEIIELILKVIKKSDEKKILIKKQMQKCKLMIEKYLQ